MKSSVPADALSTPLTDCDRDELRALESVIEGGIKSFVQVGQALLTVRDKRLYREISGTFEGYCQTRWQLTRRHADRLIEAAEVVGQVQSETHGSHFPLPQNERQARALASLRHTARGARLRRLMRD